MKHTLRRDIRQKLNELQSDTTISIALSDNILPHNTRTLFVYLPQGNEINCEPLTTLAIARGIHVGAPCVRGDDLEFRAIQSVTEPFHTGNWGIREPLPGNPLLWSKLSIAENVDPTDLLPLVILVPALAFTRSGHRLGRGKGYYDRFLTKLLSEFASRRNDITLIGTCYHWQIHTHVPIDAHDIAVDCLLTDQGVILGIEA